MQSGSAALTRRGKGEEGLTPPSRPSPVHLVLRPLATSILGQGHSFIAASPLHFPLIILHTISLSSGLTALSLLQDSGNE